MDKAIEVVEIRVEPLPGTPLLVVPEGGFLKCECPDCGTVVLEVGEYRKDTFKSDSEHLV